MALGLTQEKQVLEQLDIRYNQIFGRIRFDPVGFGRGESKFSVCKFHI